MSPVMEFESKNVEKAIQKASEKLNIPPEKLKHDVISYGSTGIFGLVGSKKARIRVTLPEKIEKQVAPKDSEKPPEVLSQVSSIADEAIGKTSASEYTDDPVALGKEVLQKLIDFITIGAEIEVANNNDKICYNISGGNTAILIGKHGQTLEAMQYLVEKIVNKQIDRRIRLEIDVEGYLVARRERLESLAMRLGEKVKRTGKPLTAGQFNAHDRRIIHITLKEDSAVRTHSVGEGYIRKLKIYPKRKNKKNNQRHE